MESLLTCLADEIPGARGATAADALLSYVTGYVLQEQHDAPPALDAASLAEAPRRFPRMFAETGMTSECC